MTRRGVLTSAAAIAGASALPQFLVHSRRSIGHVVVDERIADSARFASGFNGTHLHAVSALDDLCSRWYRTLRKEVQADNGHVAGLTNWMDYVIMSECAAEIGYVRAFHSEHVPEATRIEHLVSAHPELAAQMSALDQPHAWAQALGRALASGAHLRSGVVRAEVFSARTVLMGTGHVRMVSWVFSPRI